MTPYYAVLCDSNHCIQGSNDRVLKLLRACPFYVPQTQSNAEGKPEGGHFVMDKFIQAAGLPQGKKVRVV